MKQELAKTDKQSLLVSMADKYQMHPEIFKNVVKSTVMPSKATNEQMAAFLLVANQYDLNPITKEIYAFPAKGGGIQPVVGIDGWINLAQRRPEFDGMDFEYGDGCVTCRIHRKDRSHPVEVTEFMDECARPTEPWKSHPRRMLRHKATIQAIRYAFGFSGIKDEDEAERSYETTTIMNLNEKLAEETAETSSSAQYDDMFRDVKDESLAANEMALESDDKERVETKIIDDQL